MSSTPSKRSGRRRGTTQTREAIALAAQAQFAELGYDRATFRGIARAAGVDPALVVHFFGSKEALFREVMKLPPVVADALAALADGPRELIGRRLAEVFVRALEHPATRAIMIGRIRSASQHADAAALVRETVARDMGRLTSAMDADRPETRAVLIGSHIVGVTLTRHVVLVEPIASMPAAELVDLLAPTFQHFLTGPLAADA